MQITRLSLAQFDKDDSERPDVDFFAIILFFDEFWGHPGGCACEFRGAHFFFGELESISKISNFDISLWIDEYIIAFEISMDLSFPVNGF